MQRSQRFQPFQRFQRILPVSGVILSCLLAGVVAIGLIGVGGRPQIPTPSGLPLSRAEFASMVEALSEPEGYFDTDNFITNETSYLHVVDRLADQAPGGVYLGVGPDQNFSYIVHSDPDLAFIIDIRRQNALQHLLLKVLIEQADDRLDYLCALLGRDCGGLEPGADFPALLVQVRQAPQSPPRLGETIARVRNTLILDYGMDLSAADLDAIEYVHRSFAGAGLSMRFSTFGRSSSGYPSLEEILLEGDRDGQYQSYLSTEELFGELRAFQRENRLVPVVGDFAGPDALRGIARYMRAASLEASVFYVSNVEFYLFGLPEWDRYVENLSAIPFRDDAIFIRSYFPTGGPIHPQNVPGHRSTSLVQDVAGFLEDRASGRVTTYQDLVTRHLR